MPGDADTEAVLTFSEDTAEGIRAEVTQRLYGSEPASDEEESAEPTVVFSPADVIVHGLFSISTYQTVSGFAFLGYSVFQLYLSAGWAAPHSSPS